jgi:DNA polymerase-3 subunit beta
MKISVQTVLMQQALDKTISGIDPKQGLGSFEKVRLDIEPERIILSASSKNFSTELFIDKNIRSEGRAVCGVSGQLFKSLIDTFSSDYIEFDLQEKNLFISANGSKFRLGAVEVSELVPRVNYKEVSFRKIDFKSFISALKKVSYCVTTSDAILGNRPALGGVLIDKNYIVGTDGYRMALYKNITDMTTDGTILPLSSVKKLISLYSNDNLDVGSVHVNTSFVYFAANGVLATSRILDGNYPRYASILPQDKPSSVSIVDRKLLLMALNRSLLLDTKRVALTFLSSSIQIESESSLGGCKDNVPCDASGGENRILINPKFLVDSLRHMEEDKIALEVHGPTAPLMVKEKNYVNMLVPCTDAGR